MSREKQIEEMAKEICHGCPNGEECKHCLCEDWYNAEALYNAGYRKQREGEWIKDEESKFEHRFSLQLLPYWRTHKVLRRLRSENERRCGGMTCQECKNYEDCNKRAMLKFEIYNDGWIDEPHLCTYVESICLRFEKKGGAE